MNQDLIPILFIGHGSPMNAIEDNVFTKEFKHVAKNIKKPKAILCISAHWYTDGTKVTAMESPNTIHDFYGFPKDLYDVEYPAKGDIMLANEVSRLLNGAKVDLDNSWGLDHGCWSVLRHMYSEADIPIVQLSIDYNLSTKSHMELAKKLFSLRLQDVLITGSGNIVHDLSAVDFGSIDKIDSGYAWANRAREIINEAILKGDLNTLLDYKKNRELDLAIPSPEHFLPLLYILGLKLESEKIDLFNDTIVGGSISMTSVKIG